MNTGSGSFGRGVTRKVRIRKDMDPHLRHLDVLNELAFLCMDFDFFGQIERRCHFRFDIERADPPFAFFVILGSHASTFWVGFGKGGEFAQRVFSILEGLLTP